MKFFQLSVWGLLLQIPLSPPCVEEFTVLFCWGELSWYYTFLAIQLTSPTLAIHCPQQLTNDVHYIFETIIPRTRAR